MDFSPSAKSRICLQKAEGFFERYVQPHNAVWHQGVPDAVLRNIPMLHHALRQSAKQGASLAAYFTTPEQLRAPPQIG